MNQLTDKRIHELAAMHAQYVCGPGETGSAIHNQKVLAYAIRQAIAEERKCHAVNKAERKRRMKVTYIAQPYIYEKAKKP